MITSVDVVVVGGTVAGVVAAESAACDGAAVYLVAPRPYLGEDLCSTLRLALPEGRELRTQWETELRKAGATTTPAHVKATLAKALHEAGVGFALASYVTDVLRDASGRPCGVVVANRAGRQAIVAKVIVDATEHAWVCRRAGCASTPWSGGVVRFERVLLRSRGGAAEGPGKSGKEGTNPPFDAETVPLDIHMPDLSFASFANAEQAARTQTYARDVLRASDTLFCVPPASIVCRNAAAAFREGTPVGLDHFRPKAAERLYVLSGWADVPRDMAAELLRPAALAGVGADIGRAAAAEAKGLPAPRDPHVPADRVAGAEKGDVREALTGARPIESASTMVAGETGGAGVLAEVDVLVVGGGTSGAPAAIAAARHGARTLVIEYQHGRGGMGTLGLIGKPHYGKRIGFAKRVPFPDNLEEKMEWYRRELHDAGGEVWFGALGCGTFVEGNKVKGAVVCTPEGRGVVLAGVVIDATGNADVAISAGADYMYGAVERGDIALQGAGLPVRPLGSHYENTDYLLVDESDLVDVRRALISVQLRRGGSFDVGSLIQTRERRRVVGDFVMRYVDQIAGRTYPDTIVLSGSDYDSHGYPISPFFALLPHDAKSRRANHPAPGGTCFTPYRCLLPRGLDGILVVGLAISMDRDATAMVRMQLDMANQGYAAGVAAAMAARGGLAPRRIDIRALQRHLVETGGLPESVLTQEDSFPLPAQTVRQAVLDYGKAANPGEAGEPLAILLTHEETALPLLQEAYDQAEWQPKLAYAKVLAVFGRKDVAPTLLAALDDIDGWDAKILQGKMADYAYLPTPVDSIILALGYAGDRSAIPPVLRMAERLDARTTLSHHRAVALALERFRDPSAAKPLADLLGKPGMQGHAMTLLPHKGKIEERTASLREIALARALLRCGDHQGLGRKILEQYRKDIRGLFARHADAVLGEQQAPRRQQDESRDGYPK